MAERTRIDAIVVRSSLGLSILALVVQAATAIFASPGQRAGFIADDGAYYLQLARNFARYGQWTFDGGTTHTTGFHLLHGYICALVYLVAPNISETAVFTLHVLIALGLSVASLILLARLLEQLFGAKATLAIPLVATSWGFLASMCMVMEWPWVVFASVLFSVSFLNGRAGWACVAAAMGTLARTDFPATTVVAGAVGLLGYRMFGDRARARAGVCGAAVSIVTLAACIAHTRLVSSGWLQGSALMKAHWGSITGYHLPSSEMLFVRANTVMYSVFAVLRGLNGGLGDLSVHVMLLALFVWVGRRAWLTRGDDSLSGQRFLALCASLGTAGAYILAYGNTPSSLQPWYTAHFIVPVAIMCGALVATLRSNRAFSVFAGCLCLLFARSVMSANKPAFPGQEFMRAAGVYLHEHPPQDGRVGAWNAGLVAYASDIGVHNLDGLVNDDVAPYVLAGKLHCYVLQHDIRYIVDVEWMFGDFFAARGGYSDGQLRNAMTPIHYLSPVPANVDQRQNVETLFRVDLGKLAARGDCPQVVQL